MGATRFPNGLSVSSDGEPLRLSDLADVEITDLEDGEVLTYDAEAEKWVNQPPAEAEAE